MRVLADSCFPSPAAEYSRIDLLNYLNLYQIVKTCYPNGYNGKELPQDIFDAAYKLPAEQADFPLSGALAEGLGGRKYVLNGVRTKLGHFIGKRVKMKSYRKRLRIIG